MATQALTSWRDRREGLGQECEGHQKEDIGGQWGLPCTGRVGVCGVLS